MADGWFLDILAVRMGCMYLSDLKFLQPWERVQLAQVLTNVLPDEISLFEWNDALEYLTREPPRQTRQAAKEQLVTSLDALQDKQKSKLFKSANK